jgi:hypothetical protein
MAFPQTSVFEPRTTCAFLEIVVEAVRQRFNRFWAVLSVRTGESPEKEAHCRHSSANQVVAV